MGFVVEFVSNKEDNKGRDHNVRSNKRPPVEWRLESRKPLNQQEEDVEEQVEAVDPDATGHLEREGLRVNFLLLESAADAKMGKDDGRPGYVSR